MSGKEVLERSQRSLEEAKRGEQRCSAVGSKAARKSEQIKRSLSKARQEKTKKSTV